MATAYRAVEASAPGQLTLVERPLVEPGPGQVRIRVEAAGVCHTDSVTVEGIWPGITFPRVPGHEIAGRIDAIVKGIEGWKVGQRAALGCLVASAVNARLVGVGTSSIVQIRPLQGLPRTEVMRRSLLPKLAPLPPCRMI
jgi:D-arabinose 1-dehydrogenase-like Zn-dependent alcohol dehydrogenase